MSEIIVAVYENGVLRPINPISLSEGQTVRLRIVPEVSPGGQKNELYRLRSHLNYYDRRGAEEQRSRGEKLTIPMQTDLILEEVLQSMSE